MVSICRDCGQEFLSSWEDQRHPQTHLQTHLDKWIKPDKVSWIPPSPDEQYSIEAKPPHAYADVNFVVQEFRAGGASMNITVLNASPEAAGDWRMDTNLQS